MNFKVEIKGLQELQRTMEDIAVNQLPYAVKTAINKTANEIKAAEINEVQATIDRPTPYTLGSMKIDYATKSNLGALIYFKDKNSSGKGNPAANFMFPQAEGGQRNLKRFESALNRIGILPNGMYIAPGGGCPLDAYGNIPSSLIVQILSYFRAFGERYGSNITDKRKQRLAKGSKKTGFGFEYIVSYGPGTWSGRQHLPAGIYKRVSFSQGSAIKPIMMFVKQPSYQKRFPFYETAQKITDQNLNNNFDEAMIAAIKTAK